MFVQLLTLLLVFQTINCLDFGRISIHDQKAANDIELKNDHGHTLVTSFINAHIAGTERNGTSSSARVVFARDSTAQHNYALVKEVENDAKVSHYSMVWMNPLPTEEFCVHIGGEQHWYNTFEKYSQRWPMDKNTVRGMVPMTTQGDDFRGVVENLFVGSQGFAIFVERSAPLFLRQDANKGNPMLCFSGDYGKSPFKQAFDKTKTEIVVHLMSGSDIMHVLRYAQNNWIRKPKGIPDERMIKYPIWSSWAKYMGGVDQEKVMAFAKDIKSHGLPNSQIEIDDSWEPHYGDFTFAKKFPNPKEMVSELKTLGYRTTLWVYPFVNPNSDVFSKSSKYFVKDKSGKVLLHNWWHGAAAHVDFTNKEARDWYVSRLEHIRNTTGIDSFKFDAGESTSVNPDFHFEDKDAQQAPGLLSRLYAETASRLGNMVEVRVGFDSQDLPIFVRMLDKDSVWGYANGLKTLIPLALTMSIAGYSFVLPDMIGGNGYGGRHPTKELFIRWLQVNTFMPALQFSIAPWDMKDSPQEVVNVTKAMLALHEQYTPLIVKLAENAVKTGEPIMRPLWWVAPNDTNTFNIDDEFLVGDDLLVAPVTTENTRKRDIYLPSGEWKDHKGVVHKGGQTLKGFSAELHELPYFLRQ